MKVLRRNTKGFTLIEVIITLAILSIVISAAYSFFDFGLLSFKTGENQTMVQEDVRMAVDFIVKELHNATTVEILDDIPDESTYAFDVKKRYIFIKTLGTTGHIRYCKAGILSDIPGGISKNMNLKFKPDAAGGKMLDFNISGESKGRDFDLSSQILIQNIEDTGIVSSFSGPDGAAISYTCAPLSDSQSVAVDKLSLIIPAAVTYDLNLPVYGANGTTITWSSSDPLVITNDGIVTRSESMNLSVTLTAIVTKGAVSETRDFTVLVPRQTIIFGASAPPAGMVNHPYSYTFTAANGTLPYKFSLAQGALPTGLTLAESGQLTGIPMEDGSFNIVVEVWDGAGDVSKKGYTLVIDRQIVDPASPVSLATPPIPSIPKNDPFTIAVTLKDLTGFPITGYGYPGEFIFSISPAYPSTTLSGILSIASVTESASTPGKYTVTASYDKHNETIKISMAVDGQLLNNTVTISVTN